MANAPSSKRGWQHDAAGTGHETPASYSPTTVNSDSFDEWSGAMHVFQKRKIAAMLETDQMGWSRRISVFGFSC